MAQRRPQLVTVGSKLKAHGDYYGGIPVDARGLGRADELEVVEAN